MRGSNVKIGRKPTKKELIEFTKQYKSQRNKVNIISITDIIKRKESIEFLISKGVNLKSYKNPFKVAETLMFIEELELKYNTKF